MKALIIGCGAIGGHIAYCLYENNFEVSIISRKNAYEKITKYGLKIQINRNKKIIKKKKIKINSSFRVYDSFRDIKNIKFDYIFIAVKLKDYNYNLIKSILKISKKETAIIPPCTNIPFWWLNHFYKNKIQKKNYFNLKNIIGMTMWISSVKKSSNEIVVNHIQRGYPLKSLHKKMNKKAKRLRDIFKVSCKSPLIKDVYSEIFVKSLNALAFNIAALYYQQNNKLLKKNLKAIQMIEKIMLEGEEIMKSLKIKHTQNYLERIKQTLSSSVHTMSMFYDYKKGRKLELKYLWKSFVEISKLSGINMSYTKKIYNDLQKILKI
jgi:2-dehydropantoate 2-reductase